jgi:esterase/lipase
VIYYIKKLFHLCPSHNDRKRDEIEEKHLIKRILREINSLRRLIMATKQEVLDAIVAEKAQVLEGLTILNDQIQALKDQIASGTAVTAADLDEIVSAVNDIFIPAT